MPLSATFPGRPHAFPRRPPSIRFSLPEAEGGLPTTQEKNDIRHRRIRTRPRANCESHREKPPVCNSETCVSGQGASGAWLCSLRDKWPDAAPDTSVVPGRPPDATFWGGASRRRDADPSGDVGYTSAAQRKSGEGPAVFFSIFCVCGAGGGGSPAARERDLWPSFK